MISAFQNLRAFLGLGPKKESILCMVISEQEGAEIWMNGENTLHRTPHLIRIPKNADTKFELKLAGHEVHEAWIRSHSNLTYYYCHLTRIPLRLVVNEDSQALSL